MKGTYKKVISLILSLFMVITIVPNGIITVHAGLTISQLQSKFPNRYYWNHDGASSNPDGCTTTECVYHAPTAPDGPRCNNFLGYSQCWGFATKLAYDYYNGNNFNNDWNKVYNLDSLKAGDVIRYKNGGHVIWVTGVNGDTITYADCNSDLHCLIRWGVTISKTDVRNSGSYYVCVAPYAAVWGATAPRMGVITTNGTCLVKEGELNAAWTTIIGGATQIALSGNRIGVLTTEGTLYLKEGGLGAAWVIELTKMSQLVLSGDRIGVITTDGTCLVKEGGLGAAWTTIIGGAMQIALSGTRIGVLTTDGTLYLKDGGLGAAWVVEPTKMSQIVLSGDRIGVITTDGTCLVKEGGLGTAWATIIDGATQIALSGNRIGVLTNDSIFRVKEGGTGAAWTTIIDGATQIALSNDRVGVLTTNGTFYFKEGGLGAAWVFDTGIMGITLLDGSSKIITPPQPTGLTSPSKTDISVTLSWSASTNTSGYNVYRGTIKLTATPITATAYTATDLSQNTAYSFTVKAVNLAGESPASTALSVTTNASIVITATPTTPINGNVTVTIIYPAEAAIKQYRIGDGTWIEYTESIVLHRNSAVYAKYSDALGCTSDISSLVVSNIIQIGDVNSDNVISSIDALMALQAAAGNINLDDTQIIASDVNKDGKVSALDALIILQYASGLITDFN